MSSSPQTSLWSMVLPLTHVPVSPQKKMHQPEAKTISAWCTPFSHARWTSWWNIWCLPSWAVTPPSSPPFWGLTEHLPQCCTCCFKGEHPVPLQHIGHSATVGCESSEGHCASESFCLSAGEMNGEPASKGYCRHSEGSASGCLALWAVPCRGCDCANW